MWRSDIVALHELLEPEPIFTNHLGQRLGKEQDLEAHRSGLLRVEELEPSDSATLVHKRNGGRLRTYTHRGYLQRTTSQWRIPICPCLGPVHDECLARDCCSREHDFLIEVGDAEDAAVLATTNSPSHVPSPDSARSCRSRSGRLLSFSRKFAWETMRGGRRQSRVRSRSSTRSLEIAESGREAAWYRSGLDECVGDLHQPRRRIGDLPAAHSPIVAIAWFASNCESCRASSK